MLFDELSTVLPLNCERTFNVADARDNGLTIFLIEQNVNQSLEIADRAYVLENGRIVSHGTSEELKNNDHVRKAYLGI